MDEARVVAIRRMAYLYPTFGFTDLRLCGSVSPYFVCTSSVPAPDNGFHAFEDGERLSANLREHLRVDRLVRRQKGIITRTDMDVVKIMRAYVSLGNGLRTREEMTGGVSFAQARQAYEKVITYSFDESAISILNRIKKQPKKLTLTSTNDLQTNIVPEPVRALVAEAFCGLAMVAVHEMEEMMALGFVVIATYKHETVSIPLVNSIRLMAVAKLDMDKYRTLIEAVTSVVLLPAFSRSGNPAVRALHEVELGLWGDESRVEFANIEKRVVDRAVDLAKRFSHTKSVIRSRMSENGGFVDKVCPVCGVGIAGEVLKRCGACRKVFYCSKECQLAAWPEHKAVCAE